MLPQESARNEPSFDNLHSGNAPWHKCQVDFKVGEHGRLRTVDDRKHTVAKLKTILEIFVAASNHSWTDLTSTRGLDERRYCKVFLDYADTTSKCTYLGYLKAYSCIQNRNFHNRTSGAQSSGPDRRRLIRKQRFSLQEEAWDTTKSLNQKVVQLHATKAFKQIWF